MLIVAAFAVVITSYAQSFADSVRAKAEAGDSGAQYQLGVAYYYGSNGVEKNYKEAEYWFAKSAHQLNAGAECFYGYMFDEGTASNKNYLTANYWYERAANHGNAAAQYSLYFNYSKGKGGVSPIRKENKLVACQWLEKSALQGYYKARLQCGKEYLSGGMVKTINGRTEYVKDTIEGLHWLGMVAGIRAHHEHQIFHSGPGKEAEEILNSVAQKEGSAYNGYAKYYLACGFIYKDYSKREQYFQEAYKSGIKEATLGLGELYYCADNKSHSGACMDFRQRVHKYENDDYAYWYDKAINEDTITDSQVYMRLRDYYIEHSDDIQAARTLERMISVGCIYSSSAIDSLLLADCYVSANYKTEIAYTIARNFLSDADVGRYSLTSKDMTLAATILGKCYYYGLGGVQKSYPTAFKYFDAAAHVKVEGVSNDEAHLYLSRCYRYGLGTQKDINHSNAHFQKAEKSKDTRVKRELE